MKRTNSPKTFARDLLAQVGRAGSTLYERGRQKRTEEIKKILRQMARRRGYKFQPYHLRNRKEFLCDFAWMSWHKSHPFWLERLALVAECEWSTAGRDKTRPVLYDFRKLLPLRAELKLMIYQTRPDASDDAGQKYIERIREVFKHYKGHTKGETYFLLELNRKLKQPRLHYWRVSSNGTVAPPSFSPI